MPVFNGARWLEDAIDSILSQTFDGFELLISDNASTDNTRAICEAFAERDSRIRYTRNAKNIGIFQNYDKVFEDVDTKYFKWSSANDLCAPTFLEECIAVLEARPDAVMAYTRTIIFDEDPEAGELYPGDLDLQEERPSARFIRFSTEIQLNNAFNGVIRTEALRSTGLNEVYQASDVVLLAELALRGKLVRLSEPLFFRRINRESTAARRSAEDRRAFYSSEGRDIEKTPVWDLLFHSYRAVMRAPLPFAERLRCLRFVARLFRQRRDRLWREGRAYAFAKCVEGVDVGRRFRT